jgi:hypothetical protein
LGGVGGFHEGVESILGKGSLGSLSSGISDWHGNWGIFGWSGGILVEEISEDRHLEDVVGGESGTLTVLSVVSGDSSKIWDGLLVSVDDEVLVDGGVNDGNDLSLNLFDNKWNNGGLEEWDEDGGNLGNEGSGKGDIEIIGVDVNIRFLNLKLWGHLGGWSSWLFGNINFHIDSHLVDFNISRSGNGDPVGVGEISGQVSGNSIGKELSSVGG